MIKALSYFLQPKFNSKFGNSFEGKNVGENKSQGSKQSTHHSSRIPLQLLCLIFCWHQVLSTRLQQQQDQMHQEVPQAKVMFSNSSHTGKSAVLWQMTYNFNHVTQMNSKHIGSHTFKRVPRKMVESTTPGPASNKIHLCTQLKQIEIRETCDAISVIYKSTGDDLHYNRNIKFAPYSAGFDHSNF